MRHTMEIFVWHWKAYIHQFYYNGFWIHILLNSFFDSESDIQHIKISLSQYR